MQPIRFIWPLMLCCSAACSSKDHLHNFLYDAGNGHAAEENYKPVGPVDGYTAAKSFGWIHAPARSFDSANQKLPQLLLHHGVLSPDSMVFRADLPDGDYFMSLTLGKPGEDMLKMLVYVNGEMMPDTICTPWFRLSYKTLCKRIRVSNQKAEIKIVSLTAAGSGLYSLAFRPVAANRLKPEFTSALEEDTAAVSRFAASLAQKLAADPENTALINQLDNTHKYLLACYYYDGGGWSWAVKKTGLSLIYRMYAAADLLEQIIPDKADPLYDKSLYLLAKIYYWLNEEDDNLYHSTKFSSYFKELEKKFPDNQLIKMYLGEKIADPPGFDTSSAGNAPQWAVYQHEAMKRMLKVIDWWVHQKQTANGEMGGKYGDDVELLRWWLPAILGADDSTARAGYKRLADGIWNSDQLEKGFAKRMDDVEHSAELFRDTHPAMMLMDYGDPEYVERCMISMQHFRDLWTGITPLGHLHFKSYYLSATAALSQPPYDVDVALNARPLLPGLWAAWYNKNPFIIKSFSAWSNAWVADAARTDNGKPAGLLPSAVSFAQDGIGGHSTEWYDPHLSYDYYQWDHVGHVCELQNHLLGMYALTGNKKFLNPIHSYARIMKEAGKREEELKNAKPGSLDWAKYLLMIGGADHENSNNPMGKTFAMARQITGSNEYDSLLSIYGQPYNRYRLSHDRKEIIQGLENILGSLRYNFPLLTSEVKFTDRVYMPGTNLLTGMYTGHFGAGYEYPSLVATWKNTGPDVSILVQNGNQASADISLYNFGEEKTVQMRTWQLEPGSYHIRTGVDLDDDGKIDEVLGEQDIELKERVNTIDCKIPGSKIIVVSVRQIRSSGAATGSGPDPALAARDLSIPDSKLLHGKPVQINCTVHNIGNKIARNIMLQLLVDDKKTAGQLIRAIAAPDDLAPRAEKIHFSWIPEAGRHRIEIRIIPQEGEITVLNNRALLEVDVN